ncbi:MAG: hypothetical protein K8S18_01605 [Desulfobacula sp.]|nr:hypothetical protein [Desulfobacula sp.]
MTIKRSFCQICEQNNILGLNMVNPDSNEFFIYALPLLNTYKRRLKTKAKDRLARIKKRDKDPKKKRGYYQGEIFAEILPSIPIEPKGPRSYTAIKLYFSPSNQKMMLSKDGTELVGFVHTEIYKYPKKEFKCFIETIELIYTQNELYTLMKMGAEGLMEKDMKLL